MMKRRQQNLFQTWSGFTLSSKDGKDSESSVNESEAVHHHNCDESNEPSATSKLADSECKLDGYALACRMSLH